MFFPFRSTRPPTSSLFPYTTLFRSDLVVALPMALAAGSMGALAATTVHGRLVDDAPLHLLTFAAATTSTGTTVLVGDRKSTRLNSSHLVISYAVFCLKIKINISVCE